MKIAVKNIDILKKVIFYCKEIIDTNIYFNNSFEELEHNHIYKNSVSMCVLQLGELTQHLTEDFRKTFSGMPWRQIKKMRNLAAHRYGSFDIKVLWSTITNDIPTLLSFCENAVMQYEVFNQAQLEENDTEDN
jgi:uncharacterized protein with HEPN domain